MKIKTRPFSVPNFILEEGQSHRVLSGPMSYLLSEFDADELSAKCDEFRAAVFRKAGKVDPRQGLSPNQERQP